MTELLLTETAWRRFGELLPPHVVAVRMQDDGSLVRDDTALAWEEAAPEIGWGTFDLFSDGGPVRPFFGFLVRSTTVRWFQSPAAGADHPVFAELVARGITVTTSHVTGGPIAEYVLRAVLDAFQRADLWREAQAAREWRRHEHREVAGSRWLVIGLGSIGSAVAERARAFGAEVVGVRRTAAGGAVPPSQVPELLPDADVVVLAAPATDETSGMVDDAFLASMREGSVLVNVARGALVDEVALLRSLDQRRVPEVAVLDVVAEEPLPADSPLWSHPAVVVTPHNAAAGDGRFGRATAVFLANLDRYLAGEPLEHVLRL